MTLPVTNLDDRKFQDLVDEAKRKIPDLLPAWTNHNVSDPGVALIELFAWMTEMAIFRLNQVPDVFYTHMLNLIGFQPFPATAAKTDLTFWLVGPLQQDVLVPTGSQVATTGDIGASKVFTTLDNLVVSPPTLVAALTSPAALTSTGDETYFDVWDDLRIDTGAVTCFRSNPVTPGDAFYLGFENSLAGNALQLSLRANVEGIGVVPDDPPLVWEIWQGARFVPVKVYSDTTGGLNRDGTIVMLVPKKHEPMTLGGTRAFWLRAVLKPAAKDQPFYRASPQVRTLRVESIGGTVEAEHSEASPRAFLGTSTGLSDQSYNVEFVPVLDRSGAERVVVIDRYGIETEWEEVVDFINSGPNDRHVMWDSTTGRIRFGPEIRYPDGSKRQHGSVPAEGARIAVSGYRYGGGEAGNVGPGTLTTLRSTIPYVAGVENLDPARGGIDAETVANAKERGPQTLRAGARAVTAADYQRLAAQADPSIARVRCLPPVTAGAPIRLLLVPYSKADPQDAKLDDFALTGATVERVTEFLDRRRILGSTLKIGTPFYQGVTVAALLTSRPGRPSALVRERALAALYRFINPLTGGVDKTGWAFDTDLNITSLQQMLEAIEGVQAVDDVLLFEYDLRKGKRLGTGRELVRLEADSLFLSSRHQVVVR